MKHIQRQKIYELLKSREGEWVPLPMIMDCAAQYNARIFELRKELGYDRIQNKTENINGQRHSWYRLLDNRIVL